ncbi:MAG TPA: DUF4019 domain-containing protein [Pyrinomonadaceae bacterium]|nr:DUF4019 domain-containing protein [Pyrinomonadaceae bacterium]
MRAVIVIIVGVVALAGCALKASRQGVPPEVEAVVTTVGDDANDGRYEKIHNEAAPEWRDAATLDKTVSVFNTVKEKLGKVKSRQLHAATEESRTGQPLGHSFVLTYDTKFERGEGMETFTIVERNGQWLLAKYFVNSMALH